MRKIKRSGKKSIGLDALSDGKARLVQIVGYHGTNWIVRIDDSPPIDDQTGKKISNFKRVRGDYYFIQDSQLWCSRFPFGTPKSE